MLRELGIVLFAMTPFGILGCVSRSPLGNNAMNPSQLGRVYSAPKIIKLQLLDSTTAARLSSAMALFSTFTPTPPVSDFVDTNIVITVGPDPGGTTYFVAYLPQFSPVLLDDPNVNYVTLVNWTVSSNVGSLYSLDDVSMDIARNQSLQLLAGQIDALLSTPAFSGHILRIQ